MGVHREQMPSGLRVAMGGKVPYRWRPPSGDRVENVSAPVSLTSHRQLPRWLIQVVIVGVVLVWVGIIGWIIWH